MRKKTQGRPVTQDDAVTSDDSATESEDLDTATLVKELIKLRHTLRMTTSSSARFNPYAMLSALPFLSHGGKSDGVDAICFVRPHFSDFSPFNLDFNTPFRLTFPGCYRS